jgi:hypothetical protein
MEGLLGERGLHVLEVGAEARGVTVVLELAANTATSGFKVGLLVDGDSVEDTSGFGIGTDDREALADEVSLALDRELVFVHFG